MTTHKQNIIMISFMIVSQYLRFFLKGFYLRKINIKNMHCTEISKIN